MLNPRQQQILFAIRQHRRPSQAQIHEMLGIRKNTISDDIAELIALKLVRICGPQRLKRGRPRASLEIDPVSRHVIGLSMQAGRAEICLLNLMGEVIGEPRRAAVRGSRALIPAAAKLLAEAKSLETFSIGLATPGLLDLEKREVMMGILDPGPPYRSIKPLLAAAGKTPLVVENDVHAMSAKWLLSQTNGEQETVLMVFIADGQIGSALLVDGHPTPGCVIGSHELGHSRFPVKTRRCYCGQLGCLERIFSSDYLRDTVDERMPLATALGRFSEFESKLRPLISLLGCGIANMMNFLRPHRLVLVGEILSHPMARDAVTRSIRDQTLKALASRIQMQFWEQPALRSAEIAGWLALAAVYRPRWLSQNMIEKARRDNPGKLRR